MKRTIIILTSVAVAGLGSYVAFKELAHPPEHGAPSARAAATASPQQSRERSPGAGNDSGAARARMARLEAEMSALREQVATLEDDAQADATPADPEPARRDPAQREQQERAWHEHMADIASDFQKEATNAAWARSTTSALQSQLTASEALRTTMRGVECRSQTCRVELDDDGSGKMAKEIPLFIQQFADSLPSMQADHIDDGNGHRTLVLYMTRNDGAQAAAETSQR